MNVWCVLQWCMLNRLMCVKCMFIFCNYNRILYWFCNWFNAWILIFVFFVLQVYNYYVAPAVKPWPLRRCVSFLHAHEPVAVEKEVNKIFLHVDPWIRSWMTGCLVTSVSLERKWTNVMIELMACLSCLNSQMTACPTNSVPLKRRWHNCMIDPFACLKTRVASKRYQRFET